MSFFARGLYESSQQPIMESPNWALGVSIQNIFVVYDPLQTGRFASLNQ